MKKIIKKVQEIWQRLRLPNKEFEIAKLLAESKSSVVLYECEDGHIETLHKGLRGKRHFKHILEGANFDLELEKDGFRTMNYKQFV